MGLSPNAARPRRPLCKKDGWFPPDDVGGRIVPPCRRSDQEISEVRHRGHDQIRLMRCNAKGTPTPIDEGCSHSRRFGSDAIEAWLATKSTSSMRTRTISA